MRIPANENFPGPVVQALRARGEDVAWVAEDTRAANDEAVPARAQAEGRMNLRSSGLAFGPQLLGFSPSVSIHVSRRPRFGFATGSFFAASSNALC